MKRRSPYIAVAILFGLLAFAASAAAECAWVLWQLTEDIPPSGRPSKSWEIQVARPTYDQCEQVLSKTWRVLVTNNQPAPDRPGIASMKSAPGYVGVTYKAKEGDFGGGVHYMLRCFPDTIDPRGPKER